MLIKSLNPLFVLVIYILILTGALLFPFDVFYPLSSVKTAINWLSDTHGIEITSSSAIRSLAPPQRFYDALVAGDGITIEIWLAIKDNKQRGPARIISYSYNKYLRNFTFGQDGSNLVLRLRTTNTDLNGTPALVVRDIFTTHNLMHIVFSYDFEHEIVYVNGEKNMRIKFHSGKFSNWDKDFSLVLGNEVTGNRPWLGNIYKVAIYNRALSYQEVLQNYEEGIVFPSNEILHGRCVSDGLVVLYLFDEGSGNVVKDQSELTPAIDLHIPKKLKVTDKIFLRAPYQDYTLNVNTLKDIVVNVLGFIPFGFVLHIMIRSKYQTTLKTIGISLIIGILYTFSIEVLQYFIKSRVSSMTDIVNNNIGIALGIIVNKTRLRRSLNLNK